MIVMFPKFGFQHRFVNFEDLETFAADDLGAGRGVGGEVV